ncbi:YraN family protein [Flexivirga meconopsidis]|uniref:YraN family protein n=1 Tax=Flexivirga meconopsidis TaxID=2977121 RepID=UPI00223FCE4A|nr:YraN family protein [Flexivirga meconopsidis]
MGQSSRPQQRLSRAELGRLGEDEAARYLQLQGLTVIERNWRCREGEIDIVALDDTGDCLVVVEVKTRTSITFGTPIEAVTPVKARRLRVLASRWLLDHPIGTARVRIDVIGVLRPLRGPVELEHLRDVGA